MTLFLVLLSIGVFLWFKEKQKQHESRVVEEEERNNNVRPLSNAEIENQYFNMRTDVFLKKRYPNMISWEWARGSKNCLHYCSPSNGVNLIHKDGTKQHVLLWTDEIWGKKENDQKKEDAAPSPETAPKTNDATSQVTEYLKENASKIEETVKEAMEKGCGFFTTFTVDEKIATEEFMNNLVHELEKNTDYEVTFKDNVLEINFQNAI